MRVKLFGGILVLILCFAMITNFVSAAYGPRAYLVEQVQANYDAWGSLGATTYSECSPATNPCRYGYLDVSVPNDWDTLQEVRVALSGTTGTNLENTTQYKNVITSYPTSDSRKKMTCNITGTDGDYYNVSDVDEAPVIQLKMIYNNSAGGYDIFDADNIPSSANTLTFNLSVINPSSTINLPGSSVTIQFNTDTNGANDVVGINTGTNSSTLGTTVISNSDGGDAQIDRLVWTGDLSASSTVYVLWNATLTEGTHITLGVNTIDTDASDDGTSSYYSNTTDVFTGITIASKSSKGPIRNGIDMSQDTSNVWSIRGFIRNMGNQSPDNGNVLTYNVTEWRIYEINPSTGAPYSSANQSGKFNASVNTELLTPANGRIYTTNASRSSNSSWFNTGGTTKPYFSVYFQWHVEWNDTGSDNYEGFINTTLNMPDLYKIDMSNVKSIAGLISPDTGGQNITIEDNSTYMGHVNAAAKKVVILSRVPANTTAGLFHGALDINSSTVRLYFVNTTGQYELNTSDSDISVSVTDPSATGTYNGLVNVTIWDVSAANFLAGGTIGDSLGTTGSGNEKIRLFFDCISHASMTTGDTYNFTGNTSMTTDTGTLMTENHTAQDIGVSSKRLIGYKTLIVYNPNTPTLVNASIVVTVEASGGDTIGGIRFMDYVVDGVFANLDQYVGNITIRYYNGSWNTWVNGTDYKVTDNGTVTLSDGTLADAFEITNATGDGSFILGNNETIMVIYQMNIVSIGSYTLPVELIALDPVTGETFRAVAYGVVRVDIPEPLLDLQIDEEPLQQAKRITVGSPAMWVKNFEVYNPNPRAVTASFQASVFEDTIDAYVSYYDLAGKKVEDLVLLGNVQDGKRPMNWKSTIEPFETRTFEIRVLTPPVMEIDRDVEVLDKLEDKMVKLKTDVYLKSFSKETYENLVLNLPLPYENIIEAKDGFGNKLQFTGGKESTSIIIDSIEANGLKTVTVIYKESYPTIIITPDRDRYDLSAPVSLEILVINGGEDIEYPFLEVEIYTPGMDVMYSNIEKLETMEPLEKTEFYEKFSIPASAPSGMYIASAKFREDFTTLASATGYFFVTGQAGGIPEAAQVLMVLVITVILIYFSAKRLKEVRKTSSGGPDVEDLGDE
ncbi:MAG: hypothetical protein JW754_03985 [Candidatus Aenigmarchaeota archaeon]|nr:hypothetical protein [Candidatus Aenigmarchaeota archaeon]